LRTTAWAGFWTTIILISAFWAARITGMSHWRQPSLLIYFWDRVSLCYPDCFWISGLRWSSCLSLSSPGTTSMSHHAQLVFCLFVCLFKTSIHLKIIQCVRVFL
jgi:hypothetical protein